jgi:hypothetical protein
MNQEQLLDHVAKLISEAAKTEGLVILCFKDGEFSAFEVPCIIPQQGKPVIKDAVDGHGRLERFFNWMWPCSCPPPPVDFPPMPKCKKPKPPRGGTGQSNK